MSWGIKDSDIGYDSSVDTLKHIRRVRELIAMAVNELTDRAFRHDASKLCSPEKEAFDIITPRLAETTYDGVEYRAMMMQFKDALEHHRASNSHHPEFYKDGIRGFDLFDLIEMLLDWKAASERHEDGDILKSIDVNKDRFGYSEELATILRNTVKRYVGKMGG